MNGKIVGGAIVALALITGIAVYYLQVYYFYDRLDGAGEEVALTLFDGTSEVIPAESIQAIDASSSPIRYRACFTTPLSHAMLSETFVIYDEAEPLVAPHWFDCFDAVEIGRALERGDALAFLGRRNIHPGVDRVVAIDGEGRGYVWHQVNKEIGE
ncbi:MAG: DUF6446 family protein [Tropicimonas sp.]|uniref:DUF6446 family protein n=1 Tax=Tropicimonas sp. TaxID=2067044 RepID=UPI003A88D53B